jgi:hypothetical protein
MWGNSTSRADCPADGGADQFNTGKLLPDNMATNPAIHGLHY